MHELNQFHATKFFQSKVNLISTQRISLRVDCQMSSASKQKCRLNSIPIFFSRFIIGDDAQNSQFSIERNSQSENSLSHKITVRWRVNLVILDVLSKVFYATNKKVKKIQVYSRLLKDSDRKSIILRNKNTVIEKYYLRHLSVFTTFSHFCNFYYSNSATYESSNSC